MDTKSKNNRTNVVGSEELVAKHPRAARNSSASPASKPQPHMRTRKVLAIAAPNRADHPHSAACAF